jgi:N-acetylmuramic acid 6-phosphate etherase
LTRDVFDPRITEHRNPRTEAVDLATAAGIVDMISAEDHLVAPAVATQREQIAHAIELAEDALRQGGRVIYVGAGTSGRLGVLDAAECPPTFRTEPWMVVGLIAGGNAALTTAIEGAEDREGAGESDFDRIKAGDKDFVVGIAASGTTPYVRAAVTQARRRGARTAIVTCTPPDDAILAVVDAAIVPVVGPEVITGSTRMKAGTATKMVLNMISTGAMVLLGKTLGNLMVDLRATNAKLADRSQRILMALCDVSRESAAAMLEASGGSVKTALAMQRLGVDRARAEEMLQSVGGVLRRLLPPDEDG